MKGLQVKPGNIHALLIKFKKKSELEKSWAWKKIIIFDIVFGQGEQKKLKFFGW